MTESLRDRLIRVAKAVPFRYTDIVDAILRELGREMDQVMYHFGFARGCAAADLVESKQDEFVEKLATVLSCENDESRILSSVTTLEADHAELLAALEWLAREPCAAVARHYVAHLGDPMPHNGTGPSIAAALIHAHKEST